MKTKKMLLVATMLLSIGITSCKKEKVRGCTTSYATNYNPKAEEDDNSCTYSSKIIFWQNYANATYWSSQGVTALKFYVEGAFIGSCGATTYYSSAPTCSSNGLASVNKYLGTVTAKSYSYTVKDQDGYVWYNGYVVVSGTSCSTQQIN